MKCDAKACPNASCVVKWSEPAASSASFSQSAPEPLGALGAPS
jgi:hypothetical protein